MAKLEKYGLGLKGLRAACTRTKNCRPYFGGYGVYYDRRKDEVLTTYYRNEDTYRCNKYSDKDIINICYTTEPMTMQRIANAIHACTELTLTLTQQPRVPDRCSMRGRVWFEADAVDADGRHYIVFWNVIDSSCMHGRDDIAGAYLDWRHPNAVSDPDGDFIDSVLLVHGADGETYYPYYPIDHFWPNPWDYQLEELYPRLNAEIEKYIYGR